MKPETAQVLWGPGELRVSKLPDVGHAGKKVQDWESKQLEEVVVKLLRGGRKSTRAMAVRNTTKYYYTKASCRTASVSLGRL